MKQIIGLIVLWISSYSVMASTPIYPGKILHDEKCLRCHGTEVYSREERMVHSLYALDKQIQNCMKGPANAHWSDTETRQVVDYLNQSFYHYKK